MRFARAVFLLGLALACGAARGDILIFGDNPSRYPVYGSSWGYHKGPSYVELGSEKEPNGKLLVEKHHAYKGLNSLLFRWKSRPGGEWGLAVAASEWKTFDSATCSAITFRVNGPAAIAPENLPNIAIEDDANHLSTFAPLSDFLGGMDGDESTWQEVVVPFGTFQPGKQRCDFSRVKTVYFLQRGTDSVEHVAWIDDLRATQPGTPPPVLPPAPTDVTARGYDSRIDIFWNPSADPGVIGYNVYRASATNGPFAPINSFVHEPPLYSDFFGTNGVTNYYRVAAVNGSYDESPASIVVSATSRKMSDDELLTSVQESAFRYFYDYGHPVSGLARERIGSGNGCTIGGSGFGLMTIMVGAERGFLTREAAAARCLKVLRFLEEKATRYHGAWPHWLNGATGETMPFTKYDDGGDLVETAFMIEACLTLRQYFDRDNADETELRARATRLWEGVEWDWYRQRDSSGCLFWHWSPNYGWRMNHGITGFNECMIVYLLAIASPTHPVPPSLYYSGWAQDGSYAKEHQQYGHTIYVNWAYGGPMFFAHYTFLGFDPRGWRDTFCNYFENNRNIALVDHAYCMENPKGFKDYSSLVWGLTASDNPSGYGAQSPENDNGTITPTAAVSSMPYTPEESIATTKYFYHHYGRDLWGEFGFRDAFNPSENWFAESVLAIDQGTMAPMIENYRSGLCWKTFMANAEIPRALRAIGWTEESGADTPVTW